MDASIDFQYGMFAMFDGPRAISAAYGVGLRMPDSKNAVFSTGSWVRYEVRTGMLPVMMLPMVVIGMEPYSLDLA